MFEELSLFSKFTYLADISLIYDLLAQDMDHLRNMPIVTGARHKNLIIFWFFFPAYAWIAWPSHGCYVEVRDRVVSLFTCTY